MREVTIDRTWRSALRLRGWVFSAQKRGIEMASGPTDTRGAAEAYFKRHAVLISADGAIFGTSETLHSHPLEELPKHWYRVSEDAIDKRALVAAMTWAYGRALEVLRRASS